jgi:uncharacterized membrane protein
MPENEKPSESHTFFEDFGPEHEVWIRFERGMQIMLGVALITIFGFLGESWGQENIPYTNIMAAISSIGWAFAISVMLSPGVLLFAMFARRFLPFSREMRGRLYMVVFLCVLSYCWALLYVSTIDLIGAFVDATGAANPDDQPTLLNFLKF